jgi:hypothetical protein
VTIKFHLKYLVTGQFLKIDLVFLQSAIQFPKRVRMPFEESPGKIGLLDRGLRRPKYLDSCECPLDKRLSFGWRVGSSALRSTTSDSQHRLQMGPVMTEDHFLYFFCGTFFPSGLLEQHIRALKGERPN